MPRPKPNTIISGTRKADFIDARARSDDLTIDGKAGDDVIIGGSGADTILGGGGNDRIYASPYDKLIDGGAGVDTIDFSLFGGADGLGVLADLTGSLGLRPEGGPVPIYGSIANVENVVGSAFNDWIVGNGFVNRLDGGAGDDWITAWGDGDFLTGGSGADRFILQPAGRTVTITDFDYAQGDRLQYNVPPTISWSPGTGVDADGVVHSAWIGTYVDFAGNAEQVVLLDAAGPPTADWAIGPV